MQNGASLPLLTIVTRSARDAEADQIVAARRWRGARRARGCIRRCRASRQCPSTITLVVVQRFSQSASFWSAGFASSRSCAESSSKNASAERLFAFRSSSVFLREDLVFGRRRGRGAGGRRRRRRRRRCGGRRRGCAGAGGGGAGAGAGFLLAARAHADNADQSDRRQHTDRTFHLRSPPHNVEFCRPSLSRWIRLLEATARAERDHFWFRGFRRFVEPLVADAARGASPEILDCGCGTGTTSRGCGATAALTVSI